MDHVLLPVADLASGAARLLDDYGLRALPGGRHPGAGTANMIVPLGSTYLELIAVVDNAEAAGSPRGGRIADALQDGRHFATWAVRCDDLAPVRAWLHRKGWEVGEIQPGARQQPDGTVLRWRTLDLGDQGKPSVLPFAIEWGVPAREHPAAQPAQHPSGAGDVLALGFEDPAPLEARRRLDALISGEIELSVESGAQPALVWVELQAPAGRLRLE